MPNLTAEQIADLHSLKAYCDEFGAELVVIGAIAYQFHFPGEARHTGDVDFAVALDSMISPSWNRDSTKMIGRVEQIWNIAGEVRRGRF